VSLYHNLEETGQRVGERVGEREREGELELEGKGRYGGGRSRYSYTRFVKLRGKGIVDVKLSLKGPME
jgi:hypothetical protein